MVFLWEFHATACCGRELIVRYGKLDRKTSPRDYWNGGTLGYGMMWPVILIGLTTAY